MGGGEIALGCACGTAAGGLLVWFFKIRPDQARLALLRDGKLDEFHIAVDEAIAKARTSHRRGVLRMNKACAHAQAGDFAAGVALFDQIDPTSWRGTLRQLDYMNLLNMLVYCDPARARELREEHSELLTPSSNPQIAQHLRDAELIYDLMVEGDDSGEPHFRAIAENDQRARRAFACYHLAILAHRRGDLGEATRLYEEARTSWPSLQLPAPGGDYGSGS